MKRNRFLILATAILALCLALTSCNIPLLGDPTVGETTEATVEGSVADTTPGASLPEETVPETDPDYENIGNPDYSNEYTEGLAFSTRNGATCHVIGYNGSEADVVIPKIYKGMPVTYIQNGAFYENDTVVRVYLPDSIVKIETGAFSNCSNLEQVRLAENIGEIQYNAFDQCDKLGYNRYGDALYLGNEENPFAALIKVSNSETNSYVVHHSTKLIANRAFHGCPENTEIELPSGLERCGELPETLKYTVYHNGLYLGNDENPYLVLARSADLDIEFCEIHPSTEIIANGAFAGCEKLDNVLIPKNVTCIESAAFAYCRNLSSITFLGGVDVIGDYALNGCVSLESIALPEVGYIGDFAFYNCQKLADVELSDREITVGEGAFSRTAITDIDFVKRVRYIDHQVFSDCDGLSSVTVPSGVKSIGVWSFASCKNLRSVSLPDSITQIREYAFSDSSQVSEFYYAGTVEQWKAINKEEGWDYGLLSYTVHCTDGDWGKN